MLSSSMTKEASQGKDLDRVFRALSDRTRRELIARLAEGPAMVTELAKPFDMSLPAVGKHLRVLERAGLISRTINGRVHCCSLNASPLRNVGKWIAHYQRFWGETLDAFSEYIRNDSDSEKNT